MDQIDENPFFPVSIQTKMIGSSLLILIAIVFVFKRLISPKKNQSRFVSPLPKQISRNQKSQNNQKQKERRYAFNEDQYESEDEYEQEQEQEQEQENSYVIQEKRPREYVYSMKRVKEQLFKNLAKQNQQSLIFYDADQLKDKQRRSKLLQEERKRPIQKAPKKMQKKQQQTQKQKIDLSQVKSKPLGEKVIFNEKKVVLQPKKEQKPPQPSLFSTNVQQPEIKIPLQQKKQQKDTLNIIKKSDTKDLIVPKVEPKKQEPKPSLFSNISQPQSPPNIPIIKPLEPKPTQQKVIIPLIQPQIPIIAPSSQPISRGIPDELRTLNPHEYLQKIIKFAAQPKETCQKRIIMNSFSNTASDLRNLYDTALDFIRSIDPNNQKQVNTLAERLFDYIFRTIIPTYNLQMGWDRFPPRNKNDSTWKRQLNTFVMKINLYRIMGFQKVWLIIFGKLLKLLEWTWKRTKNIKDYKELDLIKNKYFQMKGDDIAVKYFTRLDLITYFLFMMTTLDPQLYCEYLCQTAGHDRAVQNEVLKHKHKWNYNYFWILVQAMLKNPIVSYYKPILYMNILSSIYLQVRKNKINNAEFKQFQILSKSLLNKGVQETSNEARRANRQLQDLAQIQDEVGNIYTFLGEDFEGQLETLEFYFKDRREEYRRDVQQFERRCSILEYFKRL